MSESIDSLYRDVLGRGADSDGLAHFQAELNAGESIADIRREIAYGGEAQGDVAAAFVNELGRDATPTDFAAWQGALGAGTQTLASMRSDLSTTDVAMAKIQAIYLEMLGRSASASEVADRQADLAAGASLGNITTAVAHVAETSEASIDFDASYYLAQNPDVAAAGLDPYVHYVTTGWKEGRNPSALFNTDYYLQQNPDVAASGLVPLLHYTLYGWKEGRDPSAAFSVDAYLSANPDVAAAGIDPLWHYMVAGRYEGRPAFMSAAAQVVIQDAYQRGLGRAATGDEIAFWEQALLNGSAQLSQIPAVVATSGLERDAINAVYEQVLGREVDGSGLATYETFIAAGGSLADVRRNVAYGTEAQNQVAAAFVNELGRDATPTDLAAWQGALGAGTQTLASTRSYLSTIGEAQAGIQAAYQRGLGRAATGDELAFWETYLGNGEGSLRDIQSIVFHSDQEATAINTVYQQVLGRDADPSGIATYENLLGNGGSLTDVRRDVAYGTEAQGDVASAFVNELGRDATPIDFAAWQGALGAGTQTLASMRSDLSTTDVAMAKIQAIYLEMLGRSASASEVADRQADLAAGASLGNITTAVAHVAETSEASIDFDASYYLAQNPDVAAAGLDPYVHYVTTGWKEGRNPSALFNTDYYLQQNPDVAASGLVPLLHYTLYGWKEGRDPSAAFSVDAYLSANPDVAAAGIDPLWHYMVAGRYEGRPAFMSAAAQVVIQDAYQRGLGRAATGDEIAFWEQALLNGSAMLSQIPTIVFTSDLERDAINAVSNQVLGHDASELTTDEGLIEAGGSLADVRRKIAYGTEAQDEVATAFMSELGRAATPTDLTAWQGALGDGSQTETSMKKYLSITGEAQAGIHSAYQRGLERAATGDEVVFWETYLGNGEGSLRDIQSIVFHSDKEKDAIDSVYEQVLRRDADPTEVTYYENLLGNGGSLTDVRAAVAYSPEAHKDVADTFVSKLGRAATPTDLAAWQGALGAGIQTQASMNSYLSTTDEAKAKIQAIYVEMLGRSASASEIVDRQADLVGGASLDNISNAIEQAAERSVSFDSSYYLAQYPDVAAAGVDPYVHYVTIGWKEGRNPNSFFNTNYYLQQNPDVAVSGFVPLLHYSLYGWKEGRDPSAAFNTRAYLAANPDVAAAGIDPLWHYMVAGRYEGRSVYAATPNPARVSEQADIENFYLTVLGRSAKWADIGKIELALDAGQSLASQFAALQAANNSANDSVKLEADAFYQRVFGRNALQNEIDGFKTALSYGQTLQQAEDFFRPVLAYSDAETGLLEYTYQQVTGQDDNAVNDDENVYAAEDAIEGGASFSDIRYNFAHSGDAGAAIDALYRDVLGRGATAADIVAGETELAGSKNLVDLRYEVSHSSEAAQQIDQTWRNLFGSGVDLPSLYAEQQALTDGASFSTYRSGLALEADSPVTGEINAAFQAAVSRDATPDEMSYWRGRMADGLSLAGAQAMIASYGGLTYFENDNNYQANIDLYENLAYDPATDKVSGYARAFTAITLVGADGQVIAVNAARDLLAELPVYVTLYAGQTPSIVLADGRSVTFDNAIQLANYLMRTAQHTDNLDPLLGTAYAAATTWLYQVDQPALQGGIAMAALYHYDTMVQKFDQATLAQTASGLFFQLAAMDPASRPAKLSQTVHIDGHDDVVSVYSDGTVTFHDLDPGIFGTVLAAVGIIADILVIVQPEIGIPIAIAVNAAEAGYAFSNGNTLGGILAVASAVSLGLGAAGFGAAAQIVSEVSAAIGGVYGVVKGAETGDLAAILGGALEIAGAAAGGLSPSETNFDGAGVESEGELSTVSSATYANIIKAISAAGALTSFGSELSKGDLQGALLNSLGPWLIGLAAANVAGGNTDSSVFDGPGFEDTSSGNAEENGYPNSNHQITEPGTGLVQEGPQLASALPMAVAADLTIRPIIGSGLDTATDLLSAMAGRLIKVAGLQGAISSIFVSSPTGDPQNYTMPDGTKVIASSDTTLVVVRFQGADGPATQDSNGYLRLADGTIAGVALYKGTEGDLTTSNGTTVGDVSEYSLHLDVAKLDQIKAGTLSEIQSPVLDTGIPKAPVRGTLDESEATLSEDERKAASVLQDEGKNVRAVPTGNGRTPDLEINNGESTIEIKTLNPGASSSTVKNAVDASISGTGQSPNIFLDARGSGLSEEQAIAGLKRAAGISRGKVDTIRIIGDGYDKTITGIR